MNLSTAGFNDGNASEGDEVSLVKSMDGVEPMEVGPAEPPTEEALAAGGAVNIWRWRNMGYLLQYYTVGLLYGGLPATIYGFFLGYLAVPSFVYSTVVQIVTLPWAFKFVLGMINDVYPLWGGYRRKPYMVIGWTLCCAVLLILAIQPLPEPYWCVSNETGEFITEIKDPATGDTTPATPCSPKTAEEGGGFAFLMCLAAFGYVVADVAADGLTVEYGRREPAAKRGTTQSTVYLVRTLGSITATVIVGLGMNGKLYNGTFDVSLSFPNICFIFSIPCALMIPASWLLVEETPVATVGPPGCCQRVCGRCHSLGRARTRHGTPDVSTVERLTLRDYRQRCWVLLQGKAFFYVVLYSFLSAAVATVTTTAQGNVQRYWAKVRNLQNQVFSMIGLGLFALGLYLVKRFFLHRSWRGMLLWTTIFLNVADSVFVFLTVFDVVRNQYFYLGETVLLTIPEAANFLVSTFVIVEMSDAGTEVSSGSSSWSGSGRSGGSIVKLRVVGDGRSNRTDRRTNGRETFNMGELKKRAGWW